MELLAIWQRGFYWECFSYSGIGTEGAGGGFIGEQGCSGAEWGDGAGDTRQQVQWRGGVVLLAVMAVGALQRGVGGGGSVHGGGARVWGARVNGGVNDPDVCGLWFQESLPLCMVITPSVLFSCLL
jgi:hypothetical protein